MNKILELLAKYLGIPLLKMLGEWILKEYNAYQKRQKIKKDQKAKEKAIENAKTPEDIRAAHRNNKL